MRYRKELIRSGAELLMHIGMDTVKRDGKGFDPQVKDGETVKKVSF